MNQAPKSQPPNMILCQDRLLLELGEGSPKESPVPGEGRGRLHLGQRFGILFTWMWSSQQTFDVLLTLLTCFSFLTRLTTNWTSPT